jgi:GNAT superfamily N-acetyltransferase
MMAGGGTSTVTVRPATPGDRPTVRSICNAAMLDLEERPLRHGLVLVAVDEGRLLGALILDGNEIDAIAVRPGRRGQGIGRALVEAATRCRPELRAGFNPGVRPFYEALGFDIDCSEGRCRGTRSRSVPGRSRSHPRSE